MTRYCPQGDGAFEDWVETCPECGRALTATPPAVEAELPEIDLVWLATAPNQPEAEMWADTIRGEGISVLLRAGGPGFGAWASVSMFEHQLFVHRRDHRRAHQIVDTLFNAKGVNRMNLPRRTGAPRRNPATRVRGS